MSFDSLKLSDSLRKTMKRLGFENPTNIQEKSIPLIMDGKDVIGESATGSGKTLAFACGIANKVKPGEGLQALVIAPTRELAEQVKNSIKEIIPKAKSISVYGGVGIEPQIEGLMKADIVIATPGRLRDHMQRRTIDLSKVKIVVLDEADRMFEMGFIEDIEVILGQLPKDRQSLFFSATIASRIKGLSERFMKNPIKVGVETQVDPSKLKQIYYNVPRNMKISLLVHLILEETANLIMVFCNTRRNTDFVVENLKKNGVNAIAIHGGFSQNKRTNTMDKFHAGKSTVLVCTDVAARGLHIENVTHIYNYDIPNDATDYVHRIGRTARAGKEGKVVNLLCDYDHDNFQRVLQEYREFKIEKTERPYLKKIFVKRETPGNRPPRGRRRVRR